MLRKLFDYVMKNGVVSSKKSILSYIKGNPEMVYTKKVVVKLPFKISSCSVKSISITSQNKDFTDVSPNDLRVNFTNVFDKWVNVYASSLSSETIENILKNLQVK